MLTSISPKLPMRDKAKTRTYYMDQLGFKDIGAADFPDYLMLKKDEIELHFFLFEDLDIKENYGQVYLRTDDIEGLYKIFKENKVIIHPKSPLQIKPWGQKEFALLDPDSNLLTFGESL